jgi:O-antigen/teichoic acid export membrane protein
LMLYKPDHRWLFLLLMLYSLLHSCLLLFGAVFQGLEQMELLTYLMMTEIFLIATGSVVAVWFTHNATVVASFYLFASLVAIGVGYRLLTKRGFRFQCRWQPTAWRHLLATALPFSLIFIGQILYDRLAITAIATLNGETAVGWFTVVYNITLVLSTFPAISVATLFPLLARKAQQSSQSVMTISASLVKYMMMISILLAIMLALWAPLLVPLLFGAAYQPSIALLQILALSVPALFLSLTLVGILQATGQQHTCAVYTGYALLIALPVTFVSAWFGGYRGGAVAYVLNHFVLAAFMLRLITQRMQAFPMYQVIGLPLLAGIVTVCVVYGMRSAPPVILMALVAGIYPGCLLFSGVFNDELEIIRQFWQERSYANR